MRNRGIHRTSGSRARFDVLTPCAYYPTGTFPLRCVHQLPSFRSKGSEETPDDDVFSYPVGMDACSTPSSIPSVLKEPLHEVRREVAQVNQNRPQC
jgi:hypothetical protein